MSDLQTPTQNAQGYYVAPNYTNPYSDLANSYTSMYSGDSGAALNGSNSAALNLAGMQNQAQSMAADGGSGYTAGGGNDTGGSSFGNAQNPNANPWGQQLQVMAQASAPPVSTATSTTGTDSSYPTFSNSMGIGSGTGTGGASITSPVSTVGQSSGVGLTPVTNPSGNSEQNTDNASNALNDTTRGFNPWSLQGEANSRVQ